MTNFIKVTKKSNGKEILINKDIISFINETSEGVTELHLRGQNQYNSSIKVIETIKELQKDLI